MTPRSHHQRRHPPRLAAALAALAALAKLIVALGVAAPAAAENRCGRFPDPGFDAPDMRAFVGPYTNPNYHYGVTIPPALTGHDAPAPSPHHGFGIVLSWEPRGYVWVDGSYDALDWGSARAAAANHLRWRLADVDQALDVRLDDAVMGGLAAASLEVVYTCPGDASETRRVERLRLAVDSGVVYLVGLDTTAERLTEDGPIFEALVDSWRLARE